LNLHLYKSTSIGVAHENIQILFLMFPLVKVNVEVKSPFADYFIFVSASWAPSGKDSGGAPQLKGARWFSYDELKKSTNNFSETNEIGSGGYGKVIIRKILY